MSTTIKPTEGVIYECYKGFTDRYGDYCRPGQKFKWDHRNDESHITGDYVMEKASGRGVNIAVNTNQFAAHFCPANVEVDEQPGFEYNDIASDLIEAIKELEDQMSNQLKLENMNIVITSMDEVLELAKVPFLKDQIEARFPELFAKHKVGNRYKHEDGNRYILIKGRVSNQVALVNLKTGEIESYKVEVNNVDAITETEFKGLCLDTDKLTLVRERQ
jgi:hypothetical protein